MALEGSYTDVAEADAYLENRSSAWAETDEGVKQAALIRATEYIDTEFSWIGEVEESDQTLSWPRDCAIDHEGREREGIPSELKNAVAWLATYALSAELDAAQARGGDIKSVTAGSVAVVWNDNAPTGTVYRHVKRLLRNIIIDHKLRLA